MTQAETQQKNPIDAIVKLVDSPNLKMQISRALPKDLEIDRFMRLCLTVIRRTPAIQRCEPLSIVSSVVEASQLGLELDPVRGHGYLIPRRSKKLSEQYGRQVTLCTFMPGYRGFVHLMRNSGVVGNVNAEMRVKGEEFKVTLGTNRGLFHEPDYENPDRHKENIWLGAYATVSFLIPGTEPDFEYLPASEINERRKRSETPDAGPWKTDTEAMWKKTAIRAIAKRMPLSPQNRQLAEIVRASALDENRESEDYRDKEPIAPALELAPEMETIDVDTVAAAPEETDKKAQDGEAPKKDRIRRKSDDKKQEPPKKESPRDPQEERVGQGLINNLTKLAYEEKGMTPAELLNLVGSHGYETLESIPKKDYTKIWQEVAAQPRRK